MSELDFIINQGKQNSSNWFDSVKSDFNNLKKMALNFRSLELQLAIKSLYDNQFNMAKNHFYNAAQLDKIRVSKFNNTMFDYELSAVTFPLLSDNSELVRAYSELRYEAWGRMPSMDDNVLQGKSAIWCNTIQFFLVNDIQGIERNLNIIETLTLPKLPKNQEELKIDYEFYKALLFKQKSKCEELLEQLVSPKVHKKRNDNAILNKYVSQPALGYAKLAWKQGMEVDLDTPLIPKGILPVEPLENYEIPYDFLKDEIS